MLEFIITLLAIGCYLAASWLLAKRLASGQSDTPKAKPILIGTLGVVLHAFLLQANMISEAGLNLGFTHVGSLATWFVAGLLLLSAWRKPVENLGIIILPLAAASAALQALAPTEHILPLAHETGIGIHILFSILAYSMLGMATVQALLLSIQERHLHNRSPGGFIRALPPMETMESLLFQMIIIGFVLQSMSLASGVVYLDDMFAQHLVHKTVLSILAWIVFAILLWGHWQYGWRGRTAVRWTISGFVTLLLAYFGSKYVLEILLAK